MKLPLQINDDKYSFFNYKNQIMTSIPENFSQKNNFRNQPDDKGKKIL